MQLQQQTSQWTNPLATTNLYKIYTPEVDICPVIAKRKKQPPSNMLRVYNLSLKYLQQDIAD